MLAGYSCIPMTTSKEVQRETDWQDPLVQNDRQKTNVVTATADDQTVAAAGSEEAAGETCCTDADVRQREAMLQQRKEWTLQARLPPPSGVGNNAFLPPGIPTPTCWAYPSTFLRVYPMGYPYSGTKKWPECEPPAANMVLPGARMSSHKTTPPG